MDIGTEGGGGHQICSFMEADNFWIMSHSKKHLEQMLKDLTEEAARVDLEQVCSGRAQMLPKKRRVWFWEHQKDVIISLLKKNSKYGDV